LRRSSDRQRIHRDRRDRGRRDRVGTPALAASLPEVPRELLL